jgi:hypothetical protein
MGGLWRSVQHVRDLQPYRMLACGSVQPRAYSLLMPAVVDRQIHHAEADDQGHDQGGEGDDAILVHSYAFATVAACKRANSSSATLGSSLMKSGSGWRRG